jgi:biotin carboxyl carrier protein
MDQVVNRFWLELDGQSYDIEWIDSAVVVDGRAFAVDFPEDGVVTVDGQPYRVEFEGTEALVDGIAHAVSWGGLDSEEEEAASAAGGNGNGPGPGTDGSSTVQAIMPGKIINVLVCEGDEVSADQVVCVLEAMKMQNEIRAGRAGVVQKVHVSSGQDVTIGKPLIIISEAA